MKQQHPPQWSFYFLKVIAFYRLPLPMNSPSVFDKHSLDGYYCMSTTTTNNLSPVVSSLELFLSPPLPVALLFPSFSLQLLLLCCPCISLPLVMKEKWCLKAKLDWPHGRNEPNELKRNNQKMKSGQPRGEGRLRAINISTTILDCPIPFASILQFYVLNFFFSKRVTVIIVSANTVLNSSRRGICSNESHGLHLDLTFWTVATRVTVRSGP